VAFFSDSFHEVNGVALTSRQFEAFARRRQLPFFSLHAGPAHKVEHEGSVTVYELQRSAAAFSLEANSELCFDLLIPRYRSRLLDALTAFQPDVLHVTGPGDVGMLGAWLAHELSIPLAASWHTNVHEYASRRLEKLLSFMPEGARKSVSEAAEKGAFSGAAKFYSIAKVLFAPNQELVNLLKASTDKPCFIMHRGVDAELYTPARRSAGAAPFTIGYVGRLSVEKNVAFLAKVEQALIAAGKTEYRFVIIGPGAQADWLRENMQRVELPGVLRGEALSNAYANMDVFAFPSYTDTFGNVILESLASGVPAVVTNGGGPKYLVQHGVTGFVAQSEADFIASVLRLMEDTALHSQMRAAAREHACSISWDRVFERVYESYEEVLFAQETALPAAS
jgi:glycosyltransferase involved in cell wall biosynthesis